MVRSGLRSLALLGALTLVSACTAYEYEEDVYIDADGSGSLRVSGSSPVLEALYGEDAGSPESLATRFEGHGLELTSTRETERGGRRFLHVEGEFSSWETLCRHPAFAGRRCRLEASEDAVELELEVPAPFAEMPRGIPGDAIVGFRFHPSSTVRRHNAPVPVRRGNILAWERPAEDYFGGAPLDVEIRFDRTTVLATTARILALAAGAVVLFVLTALGLMARVGRRQLESEPPAASASTTR